METGKCPYSSRSNMGKRLERESYEMVNGCQGSVPTKWSKQVMKTAKLTIKIECKMLEIKLATSRQFSND
jgi:hypothetical protein